jgi:hypothetical protein
MTGKHQKQSNKHQQIWAALELVVAGCIRLEPLELHIQPPHHHQPLMNSGVAQRQTPQG